MTFILKTLPLPKSNEVAAQHSIPAHAGCPYSIQRKPLLSSTISQYAHQTARIQSARNDCRCVTFVPDDSFFLTVHWHNSRRSCGVQSPNATPSLGRNQSLLQSPTTTPTSSSFVSLQHSRASSVNLLITITQCVVTMKRLTIPPHHIFPKLTFTLQGVANNHGPSNADRLSAPEYKYIFNALRKQNANLQRCEMYQEMLELHSVVLGLLKRMILSFSMTTYAG